MAGPYDSITPESIKQEILADLSGSTETREGSYANTLLSPGAYQIWLAYQMFPQIQMMIFPDASSGEYIDKRAADFGLQRTPGTYAEVGLTFTAYAPTANVVPVGTEVCTRDGLRFVTTTAADFAGGMSASAQARAAAIGRIYNVESGTITMMVKNLSGVAYVTNPSEAEGGTDPESDEDFLQRFHTFLQRPISSGNKNHYIAWAREISGVAHAQCLALWDGPGTVKVVVAGPDKEAVDPSVISDVVAHIEEERPIGADVTVVTVEELKINITASVTLAAGHTKEEVTAELAASLALYLADLPFGEPTVVRFAKCLAMLLECPGVDEYTAFTLNGGAASVPTTAEQTPVVGTITITEGA